MAMTGVRSVLGGILAVLLASSAQASPVRDTLALVPAALPPPHAAAAVTVDPMSAAMVDALAAGVEEGILEKADAEAIATFYAGRDNQPVWIVGGR